MGFFDWLVGGLSKVGEALVRAIDKGLETISGGKIDLIPDKPKEESKPSPPPETKPEPKLPPAPPKTYCPVHITPKSEKKETVSTPPTTTTTTTTETKTETKPAISITPKIDIKPEDFKPKSVSPTPAQTRTTVITYVGSSPPVRSVSVSVSSSESSGGGGGTRTEERHEETSLDSIKDPYVRKVVEETLGCHSTFECVVQSIPFVSQIWHAYETWKATKKLEKYLEEHPEAWKDVYKAAQILRSGKLKELTVDTAVHGATILTAGALAETGVASSIAGRMAGSVGSKMAIQGAIEGGTIGAVADITKQSTEIALGMRKEYNPTETLISTGFGAGLGIVFRGGQYLLAKRFNKPEWIAEKLNVKNVEIEEAKVKNIQTQEGVKSFITLRGTADVDYIVKTRKGDVVIASKKLPFSQFSVIETANVGKASLTTPLDAGAQVEEALQKLGTLTKSIIRGTASIGKYSYRFVGTGSEIGVYTPQEITALTKVAENIKQELSKFVPKFSELEHPWEYSSKAMDIYKQATFGRIRYPIISPETGAGIVYKGDILEDIAKQIVSKTGGAFMRLFGETPKGTTVSIGKYNIVIEGLGRPITTSVESFGIRSGAETVQFVKGLGYEGKEFVGISSFYGRTGFQTGAGRYVDPKAIAEQITKTFEKIGEYLKEWKLITPQPSPIAITVPEMVNPLAQVLSRIVTGVTGLTVGMTVRHIQPEQIQRFHENAIKVLENIGKNIENAVQRILSVPSAITGHRPSFIPPPQIKIPIPIERPIEKQEPKPKYEEPPKFKPWIPQQQVQVQKVQPLPPPPPEPQPSPEKQKEPIPQPPKPRVIVPPPQGYPIIPIGGLVPSLGIGERIAKETAEFVNELAYTLSRLRF